MRPLLIAALFLFWPLRLVLTRRLAPSTPLNWPIFLLLLWSPVGVWASQYQDRSWEALGYLVLGIAFYFALLNWPLTQRYPLLIVAGLGVVGLALAATGPALLANIPEKLFTFSDDFAKSQPVALFGLGETINSNVLAGTLLLPVCLLTALALQPRWLKKGAARWWAPLLLGLTTIGIVAALLLTQSRGAYLALAIGMLLLLVLRWPRIGIAVAIAGIAALVVLVGDGLMETFNNDSAITTTSGRMEVWQRALYTLRDFPFTGLGIGAFGLVIPQLYPYEQISNGPDIIPHAHNLFLQVGVDLGIPGLLLYLWLWVSTLANLIKLLRKQGNFDQGEEDLDEIKNAHLRHHLKRQFHRSVKLRWALAAGLLATFVSLFIHGMVDAITWGTKVAFLPWLLFALTALLMEQQATSPAIEMAAETNVSDFKLIGQ